jgi:hypothetical protein
MPLPRIHYARIKTDPKQRLLNADEYKADAFVQIDCYAAKYAMACEVAERVGSLFEPRKDGSTGLFRNQDRTIKIKTYPEDCLDDQVPPSEAGESTTYVRTLLVRCTFCACDQPEPEPE